MSHLVFARKYRPQTFKEIVGQEHVTRALSNAIIRDRVAHALLFTGPRGVGKTTSARVMSKALNCSGRPLPKYQEGQLTSELFEKVEPCGTCSNCVEITKGSNLAVVEIDGASNNKVEDVHQLIETLLTLPPPHIKYKIYIIDEVHMLSTAAFNALLKTLEEPPPNTIFIFATTEAHKIPDTVISRCQQYDFRRFSLKNVRQQLRYIVDAEGLDVDDEVLSLIAKKCFGGMRDASSLLERIVSFCDDKITLEETSSILGVFDFSYYVELIQLILTNERPQLFEKINSAFISNLDIKSFFSDFVSSFRVTALFSLAYNKGPEQLKRFVSTEELSETETELLKELCPLAQVDLLFQMYDMSREISDTALKSQFPMYVLEAGIVKLCNIRELVSLSYLVEKLTVNGSGNRTNLVNTNSELQQKKKLVEQTPNTTVVPNVSAAELRNVIVDDHEVIDDSTVADHPRGSVVVKPQIIDADDSVETFNFRWPEFLSFVKKSGNVGLETYLKRVAPLRIETSEKDNRGELDILAPIFVSEAISDLEMLGTLKKLLGQYGRVSNWHVKIDIQDQSIVPETKSSLSSDEESRPKIIRTRHLPESYEAKNQQRKAVKVQQIEDRAREDEIVKQALSVFSGSVIEKITPIQKASK